ncbi:MAG: hypothetical protein EBZ49_14375 [Proteobacteria bacterium]|nr:hypothetical protein [Pseudomonadota bacterium]
MGYSGTMEDDHMDAPYAAGDLVFLKWWEGSKNNLGLVIRMCPPFHQPMASSDWMAEVSFPSSQSGPRWIPANVLGRCEVICEGG